MHFITCFDRKYMENAEIFSATNPPRDEATGRVKYHEHPASRCFGYFADEAMALQAVETNEGDIQEQLYTHCVVEELPEGIHPLGDLGEDRAKWFQWERAAAQNLGEMASGRWVRCAWPDSLRQVVNFALG